MSLTLAQIRVSVRQTTGQDIASLPDTDDLANGLIGINTFMNRAWWNLLNVLQVNEKEKTVTQPTIVGQVAYSPVGFTPEAIRKISYSDPNTNLQVVLDQKNLKWYRENQDNNTSSYDQPRFYINDGLQFYLVPTPNAIYTLNIDYWDILTDLDLLGSVSTPRETGEIIQYGATWRVFAEVNVQAQKAAFFKNLEQAQLKAYVPVKAKQKEDLSHAGLDFLGRDYD